MDAYFWSRCFLTIFCQRQILKLIYHDFNECVLEFNYLNSFAFEKWSVNLVFTSYNFIKWRPCFGLYLLLKVARQLRV